MRKSSLVIILIASLALSACNTVRGLGQDLESVANAGDEVI
ncbi:Entericidin EcnA/B family protein [Altererythrobacter arenosus]|uniref:Entericidin EcnA/B family protein n=1 Tax=Altererythrobacter arenosus TaxID=3032592 RepID=A0ABY8FXY8_9SPHN|nr:Entericidin EcnA/B family protein [Altererythrobacter sp. CAU 1644]WFL76864.1 Entericidin EcnA/B family protein [Altererythrobacter sp. CAU 1644]